jgi:hypothetical protein
VDESEVETDNEEEEEEDEEEEDEELENAELGEKRECAWSVTAKSSATIKAMPPSRPSSVSPTREERGMRVLADCLEVQRVLARRLGVRGTGNAGRKTADEGVEKDCVPRCCRREGALESGTLFLMRNERIGLALDLGGETADLGL